MQLNEAALLFLVLLFLWLPASGRGVAFWLYLWQLKEYHTGRFWDHFRTLHGKAAIWNRRAAIKAVIVLCLFGGAFSILFAFLFPEFFLFGSVLVLIGASLGFLGIYAYEAWRLLTGFRRKDMPLPVFTGKISILSGFSLGIVLLLAAGTYVLAGSITDAWDGGPGLHVLLAGGGLIIIDLLLPVAVSAIVLGFQPFTVLMRNRMIGKAKQKRSSLSRLRVVGITGSYGKTSTKEFLAAILSGKFRTVKTSEHRNSEVGISQTILQDMQEDHEVFVVEMGAYGKGGIALLADIVKPHIGIVTGVNEQHLATFGSMENLLSAEGGKELVDALPEDGVAFVNQQSRLLPRYEKSGNVRYYAVEQEADVSAYDVTVEKESASFRIDNMAFRVPMRGRHHVRNLIGAIAAARELGMGLGEIANACKKLDPNLGALRAMKGVMGMTIIDSSYSANPDGVIADLEYLALWEGKKVIVLPSLIELGNAAKEAHWEIGKKIANVCDAAIVVTEDFFSDIRESAVRGGMDEDKIFLLQDSLRIVERVKKDAGEGGVVLLAGRIPAGVRAALSVVQ